MMCGLVPIFVLVLVAYSKQDDELIKKMIDNVEACVTESKVNPILVIKLKDDEFTDDKNLKCYLKCMYQKVDVMSAAGEFNIEKLKKTLDDDQDVKIVDKCKDQKGVDACDTAFVMTKCIATS